MRTYLDDPLELAAERLNRARALLDDDGGEIVIGGDDATASAAQTGVSALMELVARGVAAGQKKGASASDVARSLFAPQQKPAPKPEAPKRSGVPTWVWIGLGVLGAGAIGYAVFRRR